MAPEIEPHPNCASSANSPTTHLNSRRMYNQLVLGAVWFAFWAMVLWELTDRLHRFLTVFAGLLTLALSVAGLAVFQMAAWASHRDARAGRFGIASLLLLTLFSGVFLGLVRWLAVAANHKFAGNEPIAASVFLATGVGTFVVCLASTPIVLGMLDSLIWISVWLLRRPWVRRAGSNLRRLAKSKNRSA